MIQKVLLAIKPGYTNPSSVKRAKILAGELHFDLLLYSAVHEEQVSRSQYGTEQALANIKESMLNAEQERLAEIESHFTGLCASVSIQACWQKPVAEGILQASEDYGADLIVLASSHHGKLGRLFLTHTDWEVIRRAQVPVLVSQDTNPKPYTNILAAVDPTHRHDQIGRLDDSILAVGKSLNKVANANIFLGHVYPEQAAMSMETYMPPFDFDGWQKYCEAAMQQFAEKHNIAEDHTRVMCGSPATGITELAEALPADLVIMGAVSRTFRSDRVLGTVAEKVLSRLDCDLLFVPLESRA